jgi:NAD(P)-dependent dehydrogenase (short-subunit alcohol dehydrogenase family)
MKTILITGGASGLGKGIAQYYLSKGDRVIVVGSSVKNGKSFCSEALQYGA